MVRRVSFWSMAWGVLSAVALAASPAAAQMRSVDPDSAIDGDLSSPQPAPAAPRAQSAPAVDPFSAPADSGYSQSPGSQSSAGTSYPTDPQSPDDTAPAPTSPGAPGSTLTAANAGTPQGGTTFHKDDLIGAAEGVFGKGSRGLAEMIEDILRKQGEPNGYIVGREGGGALVLGLRYGSGTLYHKVEGQRPVYWTGPSIGFDAGANAGNAFVLVYNLYDTEDLYHRYVSGEGQAYLVGGFNVSYLRRGNVVLVPVRMGAGLRLGINAGYMKFTHKQNWLPF